MKAVKCACCGGSMKRNGKTSSGAQRWRCAACGASTTVRYDDAAARFDEFLSWLLSKGTQLEMPGAGRTFRRRTAEFWEVWPMPVPDGEFHRVLFVDGIWLAERLVVLICCSEDRVVSWYMAQSENSRAWSALMEPIPAPDVVVTDGGSGFAKAVRAAWPRTKVQRCLFHAYAQVKRCTTTRPKLQAGRELYQIALDLMHIETLRQAELWRERYLDWCGFWADFLEDATLVDGRRVYTHERLRKARRSLSSLVSAGTLFTYLDAKLLEGGAVPGATVMWWGPWEPQSVSAATRQGCEVVLCPQSWFYFSLEEDANSLARICRFDMLPDSLSDAQKRQIKGVQGNLWTEKIPTWSRAEYMFYPRLLVLAEKGWTEPGKFDEDAFMSRLLDYCRRLDDEGVNYRIPSLTNYHAVSVFTDSVRTAVVCPLPGAVLRYTLDGSVPTVNSPRYDAPLVIRDDCMLHIRPYHADGRTGDWITVRYEKQDYARPLEPRDTEPGLCVDWYFRRFPGCDAIGIPETLYAAGGRSFRPVRPAGERRGPAGGSARGPAAALNRPPPSAPHRRRVNFL